jgi:hypothetical protein
VDEARRELRSLAGELWQRTYAIPLYCPISRICWWIPTCEEVREAASGLTGLSNSMSELGGRQVHIDAIIKALHLYDPASSKIVRRSLRQKVSVRLGKRAQ